MIEVFGGQTPNVFKVLIALEELGLDYKRTPLDITKGEQFTPEFLAISPNNRVPAIIDHDPVEDEGPLSVFESGAILFYLAERSRQLMPKGLRRRAEVMEWVMWQMAGQGPMLGQAGHFRNYAPEQVPYAIKRYTFETARLYRVLDTRLAGREFIAGEYSIADIACWPWIHFRAQHGVDLKDYPNVARWFEALYARPAVIRAVGTEPAPKPLTLDEDARRMVFPDTTPTK
jgi:GST-like protein